MTFPAVVELRLRAAWVPGGSFRFEIGRPRSKREAASMEAAREILRRLALRGDWDVLEAVRLGTLTQDQVLAGIERFGIETYRAHLPKPAPAPAPAGPPAPTLDAHVLTWLADCERNPKLRPTSVRQYRAHIQRLTGFVVEGERLGDRPWYKVARHTIRDAKNGLRLAPNTIRAVLGCWSGFFEWAIEREDSQAEEKGRTERLMEVNPVRRAKVWGKVETTRHRFLSRPEFLRLLEVAPAPMRAQYATLVYSGLRIDEFLTLPPAHVQLPTHIHVGKWGDWQPKVQRSTRDVPIHDELLPLLEHYLEEWGGHELAFFVNPNTGRPWERGAFTARMRTDVEAAGMRYGAWTRGEKGQGELERFSDGVTPHTLRHTFGTWLAQEDVQLMKIAALMGDTEETVRKHYVHFVPQDLLQALKRLRVVRASDRVKKPRGENVQG